jgi:hypothetical protein
MLHNNQNLSLFGRTNISGFKTDKYSGSHLDEAVLHLDASPKACGLLTL